MVNEVATGVGVGAGGAGAGAGGAADGEVGGVGDEGPLPQPERANASRKSPVERAMPGCDRLIVVLSEAPSVRYSGGRMESPG